MKTNPRYDGKPLLRLLELYVLNVINELSADDSNRMTAMTPKLREIYNHTGEWPEIVASTVNITPSTAHAIKEMWAKNCEIAKTNGAVLLPQRFAEMVVDDNFVGG